MKAQFYSVFLLIFFLSSSCNQKIQENGIDNGKEADFYSRLQQIKDSIRIGNITVYNSFKHQLLAASGASYDSTRIESMVYKRHQELWDGCYAMIFGEENASKFNTSKGMIKWNKNLYEENKAFMEHRVRELMNYNVDSILTESLTGFTSNVYQHKPKAKISIAFAPIPGILFGGCNQSMFILDLMDKEADLKIVLIEGFPHEINYLAYETTRENDPHKATALRNTIDEGLACYYTFKYFDGKITKPRAVEI